ncbi:MAG: FIST C-terminal domain-containing protein [Burkholderiales bacterium]|nr:FIST C-terminal domain-containing protein [Burkholderiales bacterium]
MLLHTFAWRKRTGWSAPWPSDMDSPSTLAVIFGGNSSPACRSALAEIAGRLPRSVLLGCSTAGEIMGAHVDDDSLAIALARFDNVGLRRAALPIVTQRDSFAAGQALGRALLGPDLRAVFVLCDGLHVNGTQLVGGINQALPDHVIVTGGLAGDGERFDSTWVLVGAEALDHYVTAVGFYGESLRVGYGCDAGWSSFGPERNVTRAQGNVLHELDGRPALALYRSYLGERAEGLPATAMLFPLSIRRGLDDTQPLIRTILGIDEAAQSMTFAGDIPTGHLARLMRTNTERLIESAGHAARAAAQSFPATATPLALSVSCIGRRLMLGERTDEEIEGVLAELPSGTGQVGFYSYGEMSPRLAGGCDLHNQTMTVTLLDEV